MVLLWLLFSMLRPKLVILSYSLALSSHIRSTNEFLVNIICILKLSLELRIARPAGTGAENFIFHVMHKLEKLSKKSISFLSN